MFFSTHEFDKQWKHMGLGDEEQRKLENEIVNNPTVGKVMRGTGGLRKMRFALEGHGKSGGSRVLYVDFVILERIYLVYSYPKSEIEDISQEDRELFRKLIEQTKKELEGHRHE
ncbi:MAG: type II toxin-antitoxin system RelE/ParE family toxin [Oscillospiraceae bacterium]|nr:type II toxin-antitoxin system RelE/ParE family toxin [Oscillospiraceae bacterium]